jgi:hypothetical protein
VRMKRRYWERILPLSCLSGLPGDDGFYGGKVSQLT